MARSWPFPGQKARSLCAWNALCDSLSSLSISDARATVREFCETVLRYQRSRDPDLAPLENA
jgi:hypothetical protein